MADTPCIALKKMVGREWRQGWWVGSITVSDTMAYCKNCCVWHTLSGMLSSTGLPRLFKNLKKQVFPVQ